MITIICGTNRPKNQTVKVVSLYESLLLERGQDVTILQMDELPDNYSVSDTYGSRSSEVVEILSKKIIPADKLVFISPEYNGSYPGILKTFLDGIEPRVWRSKKAALVGVASGRAGNLRGMDHLTDVLHHLRIEVFSNKVPISKLYDLMDDNEKVIDEGTIEVLKKQVGEFLEF